MTVIYLPGVDGGHRPVELRPPREGLDQPLRFTSRVAFAAAHVVADWRSDNTPGQPAVIDWQATLGFRRHLFSCGLGVAEATGTAQRNIGLDWAAVQELVRRSADEAQQVGARIASGAGTDHRDDVVTLVDVGHAYQEQVEFVESTGSQVIVLASRQLAAVAHDADDYLSVYDALLEQTREPVILDWPGEQSNPYLGSYWGSTDVEHASETFLELVNANAARIDGVTVPPLGPDFEAGLRARLPDGVRLYTIDNLNYPELIKGDATGHSDALLGAFAAVAPAAAAALVALDRDDIDLYDREMDATVMLSRHIVEPPALYRETGIAFLAWLCGYQEGFTMVAGLQSARSTDHLLRIFELANQAQLLPDPDVAADRLLSWLDVSGVHL